MSQMMRIENSFVNSKNMEKLYRIINPPSFQDYFQVYHQVGVLHTDSGVTTN